MEGLYPRHVTAPSAVRFWYDVESGGFPGYFRIGRMASRVEKSANYAEWKNACIKLAAQSSSQQKGRAEEGA